MLPLAIGVLDVKRCVRRSVVTVGNVSVFFQISMIFFAFS